MPNLPSLLHKIKEASTSLRDVASKSGQILIISRPTPDGVVSASILAKALLDLGGQFTIKYVDLTSKTPTSLSEFSADRAVLIGLGEVLSLAILKNLKIKSEIIDHNYYINEIDGIIPGKFGFRGCADTSSSTLTYLLVKEMVESPTGYIPASIVGALGEHQDVCQKRTLCGLNEDIVREAINADLIELKERPLFPQFYNLPLHRSIALTIDPILQGLSGDPETVKAVLQKAGIKLVKDGKWRTYEDLSKDERELLLDTIEPYLVVAGRKAGPLVATSYMMTKEDEHTPLKEGRDYAMLLEANKHNPVVGTAIVMGKRGRGVEQASNYMEKYILETISASKSLLYDERRIRLFDQVAVLTGEGIVKYDIADHVSYVASKFPTLRSRIIILRTTHGAEGITIIRKGVEANDEQNVYRLAVEISKPHNVKMLGHESYSVIISSLIKQNTIIQELRKAFES